MSDASLTTAPRDNTASSQHLSDSQVGSAVAQKFLSEINTAMSSPPNSPDSVLSTQSASSDLSSLVGDPQQSASLTAIAGSIEAHDPALGSIQGQVETNTNGEVTGFVFTNPKQNQAYENSLTKAEQQGSTLKEAITDDGTNLFTQSSVRGVMEMNTSGVVEDNTHLIAPEQYAPTPRPPAPAAPSAPYYDGSNGVLTIGG